MLKHNNNQKGFALLMSLIVVGVVVSVGLTILDLSIKQLMLSSNSKDSEIALHAANAGLECAQYWRNNKHVELENSDDNMVFSCSERIVNNIDSAFVPVDLSFDGEAHKYNFKYTWGMSSSTERCSDITMFFLTSDNGTDGVKVTGMKTKLSGYPDDEKFCEPGGRCAIISVKGYNKPCANIGTHGTLQREVLLES